MAELTDEMQAHIRALVGCIERAHREALFELVDAAGAGGIEATDSRIDYAEVEEWAGLVVDWRRQLDFYRRLIGPDSSPMRVVK